MDQGADQVPYPAPSVGAAVRNVFLQGPALPLQRAAQLEMFTYYLMDAGHAHSIASLGCALCKFCLR